MNLNFSLFLAIENMKKCDEYPLGCCIDGVTPRTAKGCNVRKSNNYYHNDLWEITTSLDFH